MRKAGIEDIGWKDWDRLSRNTPYICSVLPNTRHYTVKDLDQAGRIQTVIQDGDEIEIDIINRKLEVKIASGELDRRFQTWTTPEPKAKIGALGLFASSAASYAKGAYVF